MIKKFLIGTMALALMLTVAVSSVDAFSGATLRKGSGSKADVMELQTLVGATPVDGVFGNGTEMKVKAWQATNGLFADGIFGPASMAKAKGMVAGPVQGACPTGYVSVTPVAPLFASCVVATPAQGSCPTGYVTVAPVAPTFATCAAANGTPATPGTLTGGAGTIAITSTSTDVESTATESKDNVNVLGFKIEAQDSDIAVTNIKIELANTSYAVSSEKLTDYIDSVDIYMGSTKVGSADASDFSRDSGSPDIFSKSIALSDAVIKEGSKNTFYVSVSSGSVDTNDLDADWNVKASTVRYQDATGMVLSEDVNSDTVLSWTGTGAETFAYESSSANDLLTIKSSSTNPVVQTVAVSANDNTKAKLIGAFKLKVDTDSSDIKINELPVVITFDQNATTATADWADSVISVLNVKIDGTSYEADLATSDDNTTTAGTGTATYRVDLTDSNVTIDAGDTVDVEIIADFNDQSGNYADLTKVTASVANDSIDAEGSDTLGASEMSGSYSGNAQTLSLAAVTLSDMSWAKAEGTLAASIDLFFTLKAGDDNDVVGFAKSDVVETKTNISGAGVLTKISGDATETSTGVFTIMSGDTANFRVRYTVTTTGGEVNLSTIKGQTVPDNKKLSPTAYYQ